MDMSPVPEPPSGCMRLTTHNAKHMASQSGLPAGTLRFFAALNECAGGGSRPHPLIARDCGILAACRQWLSGKAFAQHLLGGLADPKCPLGPNIEALGQAIENDSLYQQDLVGGVHPQNIHFAATGMMYWARPHAIIDMTDALEHMLLASDIGDDLPMEAFRAPFPACFVRFGKTFREALAPGERLPEYNNCRPQGAYVFDRGLASGGGFTVAVILEPLDGSALVVGAFEIMLLANRSLTDCIQPPPRWPCVTGDDFDLELTQAVAKVLLYLSSEQATWIEERPYSDALDKLIRRGPKKVKRMQHQLAELYDRILIGPNEMPGHGHGEVSPHLRRGHFRMQPHGPHQALRKLMFIAPTWVRADKMAASA
jgi:hypothetical protein